MQQKILVAKHIDIGTTRMEHLGIRNLEKRLAAVADRVNFRMQFSAEVARNEWLKEVVAIVHTVTFEAKTHAQGVSRLAQKMLNDDVRASGKSSARAHGDDQRGL